MKKNGRVGSIGLLFVLVIAAALLPSCGKNRRSATG